MKSKFIHPLEVFSHQGLSSHEFHIKSFDSKNTIKSLIKS